MLSNREKAIRWWNKVPINSLGGTANKVTYVNNHLGGERMVKSLTGSEIERIWTNEK